MQENKPNFEQLSKAHNVPLRTLYGRWASGDRGERLVRKVAAKRLNIGGFYAVGKSLDEWQPIIELAREAGVKHAAQWYGVPKGAVEAMLAGEHERVS